MQFLPSGDLAAVADLYYLISERFEDRMPYGTERVGNFGVCRDYIRNLRSQLNQISIQEADGSITDLGQKFGNREE